MAKFEKLVLVRILTGQTVTEMLIAIDRSMVSKVEKGEAQGSIKALG